MRDRDQCGAFDVIQAEIVLTCAEVRQAGLVPHMYGIFGIMLSAPASLQVLIVLLITLTKKLLVASPGVIKVVPLHSLPVGVAAIAVDSVVYSSPLWKFVCPEAALWQLPVPQLFEKMALTSA